MKITLQSALLKKPQMSSRRHQLFKSSVMALPTSQIFHPDSAQGQRIPAGPSFRYDATYPFDALIAHIERRFPGDTGECMIPIKDRETAVQAIINWFGRENPGEDEFGAGRRIWLPWRDIQPAEHFPIDPVSRVITIPTVIPNTMGIRLGLPGTYCADTMPNHFRKDYYIRY